MAVAISCPVRALAMKTRTRCAANTLASYWHSYHGSYAAALIRSWPSAKRVCFSSTVPRRSQKLLVGLVGMSFCFPVMSPRYQAPVLPAANITHSSYTPWLPPPCFPPPLLGGLLPPLVRCLPLDPLPPDSAEDPSVWPCGCSFGLLTSWFAGLTSRGFSCAANC